MLQVLTVVIKLDGGIILFFFLPSSLSFFESNASLPIRRVFSRPWRHIPIIPVLGRQRQENCELELSLGYKMRPYLKKPKTKQNKMKCLKTKLQIFYKGGSCHD
jgi:hypothetical protein